MSNPSKRRGTQWEVAVRDFLNSARCFPTEVLRSPSWGAEDRGDLTGTTPFVFEAKNCKAISLSSFMDEAVVEAKNVSEHAIPCVLIKRRNKSVEDGYAVFRIADLPDIIKGVLHAQ